MSDIFETSMNLPAFVFVDGSYFNFYRYYASMQWWKNAHAEKPLDDPYDVPEFVEKFKQNHIDTLQKIPKKLNLDKPIIIIGKDCKREDIWRMKHFPNYKGTRDNGKRDFKGGPFFKMVYEDDLFLKGGAKAILKHPHLEADDCIALSIKYLLKKYGDLCEIYVITSDHDYLQLSGPNVHLYNLNYKELIGTGNPKTDLEIKIIMGDTSDNIPSSFPKCGPKTAQKCIDNPEFFKKKLDEDPKYLAQYELNKLIVSFENIPHELQSEFYLSIKK